MFSALFLAASMLTISDRDNFWDVSQISEQTQFAEVDGAGITKLLNGQQVEQAMGEMKDKKILIFVHGFDTPQPYGYYEDIQVNIQNLDPGSQYDTMIGYVWPCESLDYLAAKGNIEIVAPRFRNFLMQLRPMASRVDVLAHSLGNRLVLVASNITPDTSNSGLISNFFSIAPAVAEDSIDKDETFYQSVLNCNNMYVFYSKRDSTLKWKYPLVEWNEALGYGGDEHPDDLPGNVQFVDCTAVIDSHSGYLFSPRIYHFLQQVQSNQIPGPKNAQDVSITADDGWEVTRWR